MPNNFADKANFLWSVADLIRDTFRRGRYQDVILPFTVLRRIDCVLEPTKEAVRERYLAYRDKLEDLDRLLQKTSGYAFYNTSPYTFGLMLADPGNLADNLRAYIAGFSPNMRDVLANFDFDNTITRLDDAGLLYLVMERFHQIDLHPDVVPNHEMGTIFEELIRRFNEALNENPGEHFTPREVIRLMVNLMIAPDRPMLTTPHIVRTICDPCCGTGGMLTLAKDAILALNPEANVYLFGQEVNPETYAVCKSDLYMKDPTGRDAEQIAQGSTLAQDAHTGQTFGYQLANPPYGKDWKMDRRAVEQEARKGYAGRFGAGTPRISDGQLLFLQHMLSKMPPLTERAPLADKVPLTDTKSSNSSKGSPDPVSPDPGGGRVAIIMNGSPLFTGDAGSGESEIRRWVLENDWLEALIGLPEQLFYNTGIATYVWVLSNRKPEARRNKIQIIDAGEMWQPMRKSLGDKRREISPAQIDAIVACYRAFEEQDGEEKVHPASKIFDRETFGFRKIRVERPLRLNFQASEARIARLHEERAFQKLAQSRKRDPEARAQAIAEGEAQQAAILAMVRDMEPVLYKDIEAFRTALKQAAKRHGIKLYAAMRDAIADALSEPDPTAEIVVDRQGRPEPDADLRDYERVPLDRTVEDYVEAEVKPYVPDAWVDEDYTDDKDGGVGQVGYEINFNRYFYDYEPPRPLDAIEADLQVLGDEIIAMLREITENTP